MQKINNTFPSQFLFIAIVFLISQLYSKTVIAEVGMGVFTHLQGYEVNESIDISISGFNASSNPETVDVHLGLIKSDGTIYEYPDWNTNLTPWLSSFIIPANFQLQPTFLDTLASFPGGLTPGKYRLAAALTKPGTLDILSLNILNFWVIDGSNPWITGGTVLGRADSPKFPDFSPFVNIAAVFEEIHFDPIQFKQELEPSVPNIEECLFTLVPGELERIVGEDNVIKLDAGASITVTSSNNTSAILNRVNNGSNGFGYSLNASLNQDFYLSNQNYALSGNGSSKITPFNVNLTAPEILVVTQPDMATLNSINSSTDLKILWQGNHGVGEVQVSLSASKATARVVCRFADDGEGVVPSGLLNQMKNSLTNSTNDTSATLSIFRLNYQPLDMSSSDDNTAFSILSNVVSQVTLE